MAKFTQEELDELNNISVIDYFKYLESQGKVKFDRKTGHDEYYRTSENKFSVTNKNFYDFKTGEGGKIIKAVMQFENKSWKEAVNFLKDFSGLIPATDNNPSIYNDEKNTTYNKPHITLVTTPNNEKLISYFEDRGISKEILKQNTKQYHYQVSNENRIKNYFGIGMENLSQGVEIRNPMLKTKLGKNDISIIQGNKPEVVVFEGMSDTLSFLQLLKNNNTKNNRELVTLNSIVNVDKFIDKYSSYQGKIFLCLDGDKAGNEATQKIIANLPNHNTKDIRLLYDIHETKNKDLNAYLINKLKLKENQNIKYDENNNRKREISNPEQNGRNISQQGIDGNNKESESEQGNNPSGRPRVDSHDDGNGLGSSDEQYSSTNSSRRSINRTQQNDDRENENRENILDRRLENTTNIHELDILISNVKNNKIDNEQISAIVNLASFVTDDLKVKLNENLTVTEDLKNICNLYKSGGIAKEGRGILDEYYTDTRIVDVIKNLIKDSFDKHKSIEILEPSIGTGNFLYAAKDFTSNIYTTGFEINEVTAKIAKIFHPDADINLRSFETEFIDENGIKKKENNYSQQYDLVIGNPPYGEHRGFYKGLGEEPKIAKYEDYFVKRGLDVLKENGILAMVLPSSWLNRQKNLTNANVINAFRLPSGAFVGTQIGTDIIILQKNSTKQQDIREYFDVNPDKILGEIKERTNQFGRMEAYVYGNLDDALHRIQQLGNRKENLMIGNLFENLYNDNIQSIDDAERKNNIDFDNSEQLNITKEKVALVIEKLNDVKFKSPAIRAEIIKYNKINTELESYNNDKLKDTFKKAESIIALHTNSTEKYRVQSKPEIRKGILKYQFLKEDSIVATSLQNNSDLSREEIAAFKDTTYDGTIKNIGKHSKFANFYNGKWIHDFYYTEGNIYEKLHQLEIDFKDKFSVGGEINQYEKQKEMLLKVLPIKKELDDIIISPNHEFVHKFDLGQIEKEFYNQFTKSYSKEFVEYNLAEKFKDFVSHLPSEAFAGSSSWEVKSFVDNETVTGSDKERNALVRERRKQAANDLFIKFVKEELSDDLKERFVNDFNQNYNNIHVPDYSKFPLFSNIFQNFKGKELKLTEVQKAGIGRQTTKGVGLLAHEVGYGKTLSGVLSMHEAMERGFAKRPLISVPNDAILKQWVDTIFEVIPNAKINVLGNLGKDFDLSKFDNKDGEITLVTYEGFNNIGFSKEVTERLASKFNYISTSELKGITNSERDIQKELQKDKEVEGKMRRGKVYDWEDFKFDHFTKDEVHNANHIIGKVKIEDRRFASDFRNQNQQTSKIGINTWMAAQYIQEQQDGRNVTLLSATPFTNKPLEYYSILSLIANKRLEESGYFNVNTFFETFMEADTDMEIDAKGDVKFKPNVRRFKNNTLFQQLLSEFIDVKGEEDNPELVRPNKLNKEYKIEQNDFTREQYDLLNDSYSDTEKGAILTHILNARLIAISPYLSPFYDGENPNAKDFVLNSPKLYDTMRLIEQNKKDLPNSGQIIYSELGISEFPKLKEYLVDEIGYKKDEVGIITGATNKNQRISIQDDFNSGKIKIIIGSEAIQEGMNLQIKTSDIYLLTLPYNFTALRQVEGRAWRQGNMHENVRMNFMLTNDSIDVFMLQKLQAKQARYLEAMKKGANILDISDINTQELKTSIITNPETRANIEIELMKKRIESEKSKFLADSAFVLRKYESFNKVKEEVTKAEHAYNRILGYSKEETENGEYWKSQLSFYQKSIDSAKELVQGKINELAEKGVNVAEIEKQQKLTNEKIEGLDLKLDNLENVRTELINKYIVEKNEKLLREAKIDIVAERKIENQQIFSLNYNNADSLLNKKNEIQETILNYKKSFNR